MLQVRAKLKIPRTAYKLEIRGRLELPFASRREGRLRAQLVSGEDVDLRLPRGEVLRGGDLVTASDGRVIEIVSADEKVLNIETDSPRALARVAYHLGSRHVPVQVGEGFLRIAEDLALEEVVKKLGARVARAEAPFEPEAGDHASGRHHADHEHGHEHEHDHEHCDHPHHHHHHHHHD